MEVKTKVLSSLLGAMLVLCPLQAMTTIGEEEPGFKIPFRLRGDLTSDFGWEHPYLSFRQNTELRLYTKHDFTQRFTVELQVYLSYSNTDNQFSTSMVPGSLLEESMGSFIDMVTTEEQDSALADMGGWQEFFKTGETMLNSRLMPQLSLAFDRANIRYKGKYVDITMGKQVVAWGSGYAWNPTDAINFRNPLDPTEPRAGIGALVIDVPYKDWFLFTLALAPGKDLEHSTEGLRFKFMNRFFDYALSFNVVGNSERELMNLGLQAVKYHTINELKGMVGMDFNTVLCWDINTWLEWSSGNVAQGLDVGQTVFGLQRVFFDKFRLIGEFYYNSQGVINYDDLERNAQNLGLVALGDMGGMGVGYGILGLHYPINSRWTFSSILIRNLSDRSSGFTPLVEWHPLQSLQLSIGTNLFSGERDKTEFGSFKNSLSFKFKYLF